MPPLTTAFVRHCKMDPINGLQCAIHKWTRLKSSGGSSFVMSI